MCAKAGALRVALMQMLDIIPDVAWKDGGIFVIGIGLTAGADGEIYAAKLIYGAFHVVALFGATRNADSMDVEINGF